MHKAIYEFISNIDLAHPSSELKDIHATNNPVPYTIIDNFLPSEVFESIVKDLSNITQDHYTVFSVGDNYRKECRDFVEAPLLQTLSHSFQSSNFVHWLEKITGVEKLIPDPHLRGGGLARIPTGNKLGLHTDFNWNDQLQVNRKVNLILYLTPNWQSSWDGDLEFWNKENTECVTRIEPKANRLVFWNYESWLVHGHSNTLDTPEDVSRDNLIHFYYTSNATWEEDPRRSKFI